MKKKRWYSYLLVALFALVACGQPQEKKTTTSTSSSEAPVLKTQTFELELANGQKQVQTVIYKGDDIQKVILKNSLEISEEIKQSISEVGLEETDRLMKESIVEEDVYQRLGSISGLTYELKFEGEEALFLTFTLDVPQLDTTALAKHEMFVGSELDDVKTLKAEEYITRLQNYGAKALTP